MLQGIVQLSTAHCLEDVHMFLGKWKITAVSNELFSSPLNHGWGTRATEKIHVQYIWVLKGLPCTSLNWTRIWSTKCLSGFSRCAIYIYLELFECFCECVESFHCRVKLPKPNDMMKVISHGPCCKVVKKLFNSIYFLYFHTSIAILCHGWACIYQHLMKIKSRNLSSTTNEAQLEKYPL